MARGDRLPHLDIVFPSSFSSETGGLWSDGTTLYVGDRGNTGGILAYAFNLATRLPDPSKHILGGGQIRGIWSNGETMWIRPRAAVKLLAYNLTSRLADPDKDITTEYSNPGVGGYGDTLYTSWRW